MSISWDSSLYMPKDSDSAKTNFSVPKHVCVAISSIVHDHVCFFLGFLLSILLIAQAGDHDEILKLNPAGLYPQINQQGRTSFAERNSQDTASYKSMSPS